MSSEVVKREQVIEHRITREFGNFTVRYWIEENPLFGGVRNFSAAMAQVEQVEIEIRSIERVPWSQFSMAWFLLNHMPSVNSVEVCDAEGNGTALHRDWP